MRIVSFNCENLARYAGKLPELFAELGSPDVVCLQEVRVRARDAGTLPAVPGYVRGESLNRDERNVTFRGGRMYGVVTYARDATFVTPSWDREGRVVLAHVGGIVVANVYAVNGTSKPYFDHDLGRVDGTRHEFKRHFIVRLAEELLPHRDRLVAIGDWNVSRAKLDTHPRLRTEEPHATARREFNELFMPALDLVDVYREQHPDGRAYTWFNARARALDAARVDFALVSRALLPRVLSAEISADRHGSDHAPIALRLAPD